MKYIRRHSLPTIFIGLFIALFCISIWQILIQDNSNDLANNSYLSLLNNANSIKLLSNNVTNTRSAPTNYKELQKDDIAKLIDLNSFQYLINQPPCPIQPSLHKEFRKTDRKLYHFRRNLPPLILILVHSASQNYQRRSTIRDTWASLNSSEIRVIFLLGDVVDKSQQSQIELENNMFGDIVQGNFIDHYRNLTYKHVMALKWFTYYCPNAKYLLKTDDDIFVNTPQLIESFKDESLLNPIITTNNEQYNKIHLPIHNLIFCEITDLLRVRRSYRSRWRVSAKEYSGRYYPPYCPGYAIIYSSDVVFKLYKLAQISKYFWIDDLHITGTLAQLANITLTPCNEHFLPADIYRNLFYKDLTDNIQKDDDFPENQDDNIKNITVPMFLFSWPERAEQEMRFLWKFIFQYK